MAHEWDLSGVFKDEKALGRFCVSLKKRAVAFENAYKGRLDSLNEGAFSKALGEFETLCSDIGKVMMYAYLLFSKDTKKGQFFGEYEMKMTEVQNHILFFELEFCALKGAEKIAPKIKGYEFYLSELLAAKKYNLSLAEEKILSRLEPVGASAFSRLFDEHLANKKFKFENKNLGEEEMLSLLHKQSRKVRKNAQKSFTKGLKESLHLLCYVLNMVRKDLAIKCELRGYEKPESFRHISNSATQKSVDSLINCVNKNFPIVAEFYKIKKELLGLKTLKDYDRYAPILVVDSSANKTDSKSLESAPESALGNYEKDLDLVIKAYKNFSGEFAKIIQQALKNGWVDSHPTPSKRGGAFSYGPQSDTHAFVMLNYTASRRDAFTIAHEFGHMIHQTLSKSVSYLNMDTPLTTAETASVFGEMLLFDELKNMAVRGELPKNELISMYAGKLEDIFSTSFRQIVMTNFERRIHEQKNELSVNDFNEIWLEENKKMFGDSVSLTKNYALWWSYIPHFIHSPFYCYAYSFGQLLVLALFGQYKAAKSTAERAKFIKNYTAFLSAGGSKSPKDLVNLFGMDIESNAFWDIGIKEIKKMLNEFKKLVLDSKKVASKVASKVTQKSAVDSKIESKKRVLDSKNNASKTTKKRAPKTTESRGKK